MLSKKNGTVDRHGVSHMITLSKLESMSELPGDMELSLLDASNKA